MLQERALDGMGSAERKRIERGHLDVFRRVFLGFPTGEIYESERPDFLIEANVGRIGIEHTELLWGRNRREGSPLKEQEARRWQVLNAAREIYERGGNPPVSVWVIWNREPKRNGLEHELADLVARNNPRDQEPVTLENSGLEDSPLPSEVDTITISKVPTRKIWQTMQADPIPELSVADIIDVVRTKECNLLAYRERCREVWLLIVLEGHESSSVYDVPESLHNHSLVTNFNRIFLLRVFEAQVLELPTEHPRGDLT